MIEGFPPLASSQYGDMRGTVSADSYSGIEFHDFAKARGIDTDRYFLIAMEFMWLEGHQSLNICAVDKQVAGQGFDSIDAYAKAHDGKVPVVRFRVSPELNDLGRFMKRLAVVLAKDMPSVRECEILDTVDLS
jgi:hypothetical protein